MTTIATDGRTIAADGLGVLSWGLIMSTSCKKIVVCDRKVYALTGADNMMLPVVEWHLAGADPKALPVCSDKDGWSLLVITDRGMFMYSSDMPYPTEAQAPHAIGSGMEIAIGAMEAGASAEEAIRIAARRHTGTGGEIQVVDIAEALARSSCSSLSASKVAAE